MDFISELIAKMEKGPVLDRDRGPKPKKRIHLKARRSLSGATRKRYRMSPTSRAKAYAWRKARDATIVGQWYHFGRACRAKAKYFLKRAEYWDQAGNEVERANREAKAATWAFSISLDEWVLTWLSCCDIMVIEGQVLRKVPAWMARGRKPGDVKLARMDTSKPWTPDNTVIVHGGEVIARFKPA